MSLTKAQTWSTQSEGERTSHVATAAPQTYPVHAGSSLLRLGAGHIDSVIFHLRNRKHVVCVYQAIET